MKIHYHYVNVSSVFSKFNLFSHSWNGIIFSWHSSNIKNCFGHIDKSWVFSGTNCKVWSKRKYDSFYWNKSI